MERGINQGLQNGAKMDIIKTDTIWKKIEKGQPADEVFTEAGEILRNGGLVAFPTETVYGLGADALNGGAAAKIYAAKGRPSDNPLIVHIAKREDLKRLVKDIPVKAETLIDAFWPGPLTMIFDKKPEVPDGTTGGLSTVAVRMPSHTIARQLIQQSGVLIAAPSANLSGRPSPTEAEHVWEDMQGRIDMLIDGGKVGIGIESTIVDMTVNPPMILRPGYITKEMLEEKIGPVSVDKAAQAEKLSKTEEAYKPKAPGMKYRHYAPKADFIMFEGSMSNVAEAINRRKQEEEAAGKKVGIICTDESKMYYLGEYIIPIGSRENAESIAANLYKVLREFDETDIDVILGETVSRDGLGQAIMNRLIKAAGYRLVNADDESRRIKKEKIERLP